MAPVAAVAVGAVLVSTGGVAFGAPAPAPPGVPAHVEAKAVKGVKSAKLAFQKPAAKPPAYAPTKTSWPVASTSTIDLTKTATSHAAVRATTSGSSGPHTLKVQVHDHAAAAKAGIGGVLMTVDADQAGSAKVGLDYGSFAQAYGGNYGSRLVLTAYPSCVLTSPSDPKCLVGTPLPTTNDQKADTLSAPVTFTAATKSVVLAAAAAPQDPEGGAAGGTYQATSLKASGTWSGGSNTGDFTYSYPLSTAAAPSALTPPITLGYDSGSTDSENATTQPQSSWIGEGWNSPDSYVEQSFQSCAQNPEGATAPTKTYDQCYDGPIYTMSLNGSSSALVWDKDKSLFKTASADGSTVVHYCTLPSGKTTFTDPTCVAGTSNGTGTQFNDWWQITDTNGTQYSFGLNHLPGWATGKTSSASVATEPVYSVKSTDPCYNSAGFSSSVCTVPYRWGLDYVTDVHSNAMAYYYHQDTNFYGAFNGASQKSYVRDQYLTHIDYGFTDGNAYVAVPDQIVFGTSARCVATDCTLSSANAANWPDVPYTSICASGATCTMHQPSFFSTVRLTSVVSQQYSLADAKYLPVDSYALAQSMPQSGDGTSPTLWLDSIQHTGAALNAAAKGSAAITLPKVTFGTTEQLNSRVDAGDGLSPFKKYRLGSVTTETGSTIQIVYGLVNACAAGSPPTASTNTKSCYPISWTPDGLADPITDWFNKYAVTSVIQNDPAGGDAQVTRYSYGNPAWHFDDNELVKAKYRTYGQFRGYGDVTTYVGNNNTDIPGDPQTKSETVYYRGMSKNNGGATVNLTDSLGGQHEDVDELAGQVMESSAFLGDAVDNSTITSYWVSASAANRARTGLPDLTSNWVEPVETFSRQALTSTGSTTWRYTQTDTSYDTNTADANFGLVTHEYQHTSPVDARYDRCTTTTYGAVGSRNLTGLPTLTEIDAVACGGFTSGSPASVPGGTNTLTAPATVNRPAQVISATRDFYDDPKFGTTFPQATAATHGDVTMAQTASDYSGGAFTWKTTSRGAFDSIGRQTDAYDAAGNDTKTSVATNSLGLVTGQTITNPLSQGATSTLDVQRGVLLTTSDANKVTTTQQYDALGRLRSVWLDSRPITSLANYVYDYGVNNNATTWALTKVLNEEGGYRQTIQIYDGLMRPRQTQAESPRGMRLVSDTFYDSRGWVSAKYTDWRDTSGSVPTTTLLKATDLASQVPKAHEYTYNSLGQVVIDQDESQGVEKSRTTTLYQGDRTTVFPPDGGTVTTTIVDPLARTTQIDNYIQRPTLHSPSDPFTGRFTITGGAAKVTTYGFDSRGDQNSTTQGAAGSSAPTWTETYNLLGQITEKTDPDAGKSTGMQYDANGNLTQSTDSLGKTTSTTYDALNRKTGTYAAATADQKAGPTGNQIGQWIYDNANKVAGVTDPIGQLTTANTYVAKNTFTEQQLGFNVFGESLGSTLTVPGSEGSLGGSYRIQHSYTDNLGLLQYDGYDKVGGLPEEFVQHTYRTQFDLPDALGSDDSSYAQTTSYDETARVEHVLVGPSKTVNTSIDYTYDDHTDQVIARDVDHLSADGKSTPVDDHSYTYDLAGNLTGETSVQKGSAAATETQCYRYDGLVQLTTAWTSNDTKCTTAPTSTDSSMVSDPLGSAAAYWTTWAFDDLGDRSNQIQHAFTGGPSTDTGTNYTYGNTDGTQPHVLKSTATAGASTGSTSYGYDAAGDTTSRNAAQGNQTLSYDNSGKLTGVTGSTAGSSAYEYDADGNLLVQKDPGSTTLYAGGQQFVMDTNTGTITGTRYYTLPDGSQVIRSGSSSTSFQYAVADPHGTPSVYLDYTGATATWRQYTPYGEPRGAAVATPDNHGFLNKAMDLSTGLTSVGARNYDPVIGRFITVDPVLELTDPTQLNGFGYASNDPVSASDPSGLSHPKEEEPDGNASWTVSDNCQSDNACSPGGKGPTASGGGGSGSGSATKKKTSSSKGNVAGRFAKTLGLNAGDTIKSIMPGGCMMPNFDGSGGGLGECIQKSNPLPLLGFSIKANWDAGKCAIVFQCGDIANDALSMVGCQDGVTAECAANVTFTAASMLVGGGEAAVETGIEREAVQAQSLEARAADAPNFGIKIKSGAKCSFAAGTLVLMADGSQEPIDQLQIGDKVASTDPVDGKVVSKAVTALHDDLDTDMADVTVADAKGNETVIKTTQNHPFWDVTTAHWTRADSLQAGDELKADSGPALRVAAVRSFEQPNHRFNLTVAYVHTYYVLAGTTPVLVHNCGEDDMFPDAEAVQSRVDLSQAFEKLDDDVKETVGQIANNPSYPVRMTGPSHALEADLFKYRPKTSPRIQRSWDGGNIYDIEGASPNDARRIVLHPNRKWMALVKDHNYNKFHMIPGWGG